MSNSVENYRLITDYYASFGSGGSDGIAKLASYYADDKSSYVAGHSELSGLLESGPETEKYLLRLMELNEGNLSLVGTPQIILAGDTFVAVIIKEKHQRAGRPEIIVPRLCIYEIANGKISKSFLWQVESAVFDKYYSRS